jgi:hypothetical protein
MSTTTPQLLTAAQLADVLHEHVQTVRKHTRQGLYAGFAINVAAPGRPPKWRYDPRGLEKWLDARRTAA